MKQALKLFIIDDEQNTREAISGILQLYGNNIDVAATFSSVAAAIQAIKTEQPDVLLLDIEVGQENGFDIFKHFPQPAFKIIFITAYQQYAVQAFRFAALDYLLKPVDPDLLIDALRKASDTIDREKFSLKIDSFLHNVGSLTGKQKRIVLKTADNIHVVSVGDIMYCEAERSYTTFFMNDKSRIMVSQSMGEYEELLGDYGFVRIHKSYLINMQFVKRYEKGEGGSIVLNDNSALPVATRKKEQLLHLLTCI